MINKITLTMCLAASMLASSAQAQMKLICRADNDQSGTRDSILYFYSGSKGVTQIYKNVPEYATGADSFHTYKKNGTALEMTTRTIIYRTSTRIDSLIEIENDNGTWKNSYRAVINEVGGKPDTVEYQSWSSQSSKWNSASSYRVYTFSGNNPSSIERIRRQWSNKDKKWVLSFDWKVLLNYTGNNLMDSTYQDYKNGGFKDSLKTTYTYSGTNKTGFEIATSDGTTWTIIDRGFYTYTGNQLNLFRSELYTGSVWQGNDSVSYFYTGTNIAPDSFIHFKFQFTNMVPQSKHVVLANTAGQWTTDRTESWNGKNAPDGKFEYLGSDSTVNWYYGWNVSVDDVDAQKVNLLSIYPTPASNDITIKLNDGMKNQDIQFAVIDMQGRTVSTWTQANYQSAVTVSVADLPAGNYILHARNGNAVVAERFIISK